MIHVDDRGNLRFEKGSSTAYVRLPLSDVPTKEWRRLFGAIATTRDYRVHVDEHGQPSIQVLLSLDDIHDPEAILERLRYALDIVDQVNRRLEGDHAKWDPVLTQIEAWWTQR